MNKWKKPKFDPDDLGPNLFLNQLQINVFSNNIKQLEKDKETGFYIPVYKEFETDESIKVYTSAERRKIINKLSSKAKDLLLWSFFEIDYKKDYFWINKARYMEELEIKSPITYREALNELIRYGLLQSTLVKEIYYINPDFFFKGSRVDAFPNKIKRIKTKTE